MSDRFNHIHNIPNMKSLEYDKEIQLLSNMESVHLKKKAAFDELLRYTYKNVAQPEDNNRNHKST